MKDEETKLKSQDGFKQKSAGGSDQETSEDEEICEEFLVKLKGQNYLQTKWITERDFSAYDY